MTQAGKLLMITFSERDAERQEQLRRVLLDEMANHHLRASTVEQAGDSITVTAVGPETEVRGFLPVVNMILREGMVVLLDAEYLPLMPARG